MISSGFWKYWRTYCLRFLLKLFYLSLASLCLAVVHKTALKSSTSCLNFWIYDMYAERLKFLPQPPRPLWPPLPPQPPWPCTWSMLIELGFLVISQPWVVVASPSSLLLPTSGGVVSVSGVMNFPFWIFLNSHNFPRSVLDITPLVCR